MITNFKDLYTKGTNQANQQAFNKIIIDEKSIEMGIIKIKSEHQRR